MGFLEIDPFSAALPSPLPSALLAPNAAALAAAAGRGPVVTLQRGGTKAGKVRVSPLEAQLLQEIWFHGPISRKEAEDLLKQVQYRQPAIDILPVTPRFIWICFIFIGRRFLGSRVAGLSGPVRADGNAIRSPQAFALGRSRRRCKSFPPSISFLFLFFLNN